MIGPALQGAQLISNLGRIAPWAATAASMIPGISSAVNAAGKAFNRPAAPYNPGGGGMGGKRGTGYRQSSSAAPERQMGQQAVLGGQPVYWGGKDYGWQRLSGGGRSLTMDTLNAPGVQNRFIQDEDYGVYGGTSPAADRAYRQEVSRVAQLTAQDPELQRYEAARKLAVAPGATQQQVQAAEDIGMQIWRDKYGATPMGRPGGAVGSFNPLMQRTFGYQTGMSPQETQAMQATAAPVPVAPGEVPYQQGDLGTRATLETGYDPSQYGLSPNLVEDMKKRLLQQAGK